MRDKVGHKYESILSRHLKERVSMVCLTQDQADSLNKKRKATKEEHKESSSFVEEAKPTYTLLGGLFSMMH